MDRLTPDPPPGAMRTWRCITTGLQRTVEASGPADKAMRTDDRWVLANLPRDAA